MVCIVFLISLNVGLSPGFSAQQSVASLHISGMDESISNVGRRGLLFSALICAIVSAKNNGSFLVDFYHMIIIHENKENKSIHFIM